MMTSTRQRFSIWAANDRPLKLVREATGSRITLKSIEPWGLRVFLAEDL